MFTNHISRRHETRLFCQWKGTSHVWKCQLSVLQCHNNQYNCTLLILCSCSSSESNANIFISAELFELLWPSFQAVTRFQLWCLHWLFSWLTHFRAPKSAPAREKHKILQKTTARNGLHHLRQWWFSCCPLTPLYAW